MFFVICSIEGLNQTQKLLGKQRWGEGRGRGRGARGRGAQSPSKGPMRSLYSRDRVPTYRRSRSVSSDSYDSSRSRSRSPRRKKDRKDRSSRRRHSRYYLLEFNIAFLFIIVSLVRNQLYPTCMIAAMTAILQQVQEVRPRS